MPLLSYDVVDGAAAGDDVVVFAHGILGSKNNWKSFAKALVQARPHLRALLVDLRNHGESHGFAPPHTVAAAADDVAALCAQKALRPRFLVGHSWGGKCLLELALRTVDVEAVVVVDSPPGVRSFAEGGREEIARVLEAVRAVPMPVASRKDLVEQLRAKGLSEPIAQWMTTNLNATLHWRFDLDAIGPMLASFGALDLWPALRSHRAGLHVRMVRGGRSDRWSADELTALADAAAAGIIDVDVVDAGHWVHTEQPAATLAAVLRAIPEAP
jgi:esterase